jgi:hypothetical protein
MKNRDIGIILGILPFLVITLTLFIRSSADNPSQSGNAIAQPYPYLQPFPSPSQPQQPQQPQQQQLLNTATSGLNGNNNNNNNNNNPLQNLQNQIDQLKAIIGNLHTQKLVVTERSAPVFTQLPGPDEQFTESKAVCNSDEIVTGGGWVTQLLGRPQGPIFRNSASGNGWVVDMDPPVPFKAVAECAKLT